MATGGDTLIPVVITGVDTSTRKIAGGAARPVALAGLTQPVIDELSSILGGGVEFASLAEAQAGVVTDKAVAPSSLPLFKPNGSAIQVTLNGNARGANAVDLSQGGGANVASGVRSVLIGGSGSRATGQDSICIGANYSTVSGNLSAMISNAYATLSGNQSIILGGYIGSVAGTWSSLVGCYNVNLSHASGSFNSAIGASSSTLSTSGFRNIVLGGQNINITHTASDNVTVNGNNTDLTGTAARNALFGRNSLVSGDGNVVFCEAASQESFTQSDAFYIYGYRPFMSAPNSAPTDSEIKNGVVSFWLNESSNELTFRVRYSDATLKTGTVALA